MHRLLQEALAGKRGGGISVELNYRWNMWPPTQVTPDPQGLAHEISDPQTQVTPDPQGSGSFWGGG